MELLFEARTNLGGFSGHLNFVQRKPHLHPEPVLRPDTFADGAGVSIYGSVLREGGTLRMWYHAIPKDWDYSVSRPTPKALLDPPGRDRQAERAVHQLRDHQAGRLRHGRNARAPRHQAASLRGERASDARQQGREGRLEERHGDSSYAIGHGFPASRECPGLRVRGATGLSHGRTA